MVQALILNKGGPPYGEIVYANGEVSVRQPRNMWLRRLFCLVMLLLVSVTVVGGLVAAYLVVWIAMTDGSSAAGFRLALGAFGLGLAVCCTPGMGVWLWLQAQIVAFRVRIGNGRYRLGYGLIRLSLALNIKDAIVIIDPVHSRGDFGYGAHLKRRKGGILRLPFLPWGVFGSKSEARREAERIRTWLQENTPIGEVILSKWWDKARDIEEEDRGNSRNAEDGQRN